MMLGMYYGLTLGLGTLSTPWSWLVNLGLIFQFPLAHSLLLTARGRRFLSGLAPQAVGRDLTTTTYATVASWQLLLLFWGWTPSGLVWWEASGVAEVGLTALYVSAWLLLGSAMLTAGIQLQTGLLGWWAVFRQRRPRYPSMPTTGLFRLTRQPIYVTFALTLWTVPTWTPDQLLLAVLWTGYCVLAPLHKEQRFTHLFGDAFREYQQQVPYWLPQWSNLSHLFTQQDMQRNDCSIYETHGAEWWRGSQRFLRTLQSLVPPRMRFFSQFVDWQGKTVLDLGCGGGFMSEELARRGATVIGVDPAAAALQAAREHAQQSKQSIDYRHGAGESLPLEAASVDLVVCVDVLEHVTDLPRTLDEIRRVLRPGGSFCFDTINRNWLASLVIVRLGEDVLRLLPRGTHDPELFIKPQELRSLLQERGFVCQPFTGLGPCGVNRHGELRFGALPSTLLMYMGVATLT